MRMPIRWWWHHRSSAHAYQRAPAPALAAQAPTLPQRCLLPAAARTIGPSLRCQMRVLCTRAAPAAHGTIFPGCPTPFVQGELHGGRRAAGDARFLYDNECLCRSARTALCARSHLLDRRSQSHSSTHTTGTPVSYPHPGDDKSGRKHAHALHSYARDGRCGWHGWPTEGGSFILTSTFKTGEWCWWYGGQG